MKTFLVSFFILLTLKLFSQSIRFEKVPLDSILIKARIENKLVFIDVSTDWCGSCKWMEQYIFPKKGVSEFYNRSFINIKIDAEKGEGIEIAKKYNVVSFPTYLFINQDGILLYKNTKGSQDEKSFIATGEKAIAAHSQRIPLSLLDDKFVKGDRDKRFLYSYLVRQVDERDECDTLTLNAYLNQLNEQELNKIENILLIANTPRAYTYRNKYFVLVLKNLAKIKPRLNNGRYYNLIHQYFISLANNGFFPLKIRKNIDSFNIFKKDYNLIFPFTISNDPFYSPFKFERLFYQALQDSVKYRKAVLLFLNNYLYSGLVNSLPLKIKESNLFGIDRNTYKMRLVSELNQIGLEYSEVFSNTRDLMVGLSILKEGAKFSTTFNNYYAKSKLRAKLGDIDEALVLAKKAYELALDEKVSKFYLNLIDKFIKQLEARKQ